MAVQLFEYNSHHYRYYYAYHAYCKTHAYYVEYNSHHYHYYAYHAYTYCNTLF